MNGPTGIKKSIDAAWEKLPEIIIAAVVALCFFGFGMWLDCRDVKRDIVSILEEQSPNRLCQRIGTCSGSSAGALSGITELRSSVNSIKDKLDERGIRISNLEQQVYELRTKSTSRPDPFTGTMGRELEARIRELEDRK